MSNSTGFVSYDMADGLGVRAQVMVTKGELPIKRITLNDDESMARVDFDSADAGLKFPIHANIPTKERDGSAKPAYEALVAAKKSGAPIAFRIETQRKKMVDRRIPFPPAKDSDKVAGEKYLEIQGGADVVKKLVSVGSVATAEQITDPTEDLRWMNIPRTMAPAFIDENPAAAAVAGGGFDASKVLDQYVAAVKADLPQEMTRMIGAIAIAAGASLEEFFEAARRANN